jgi:hypothetical protein
VRWFDGREFVFDSEFLALPVGDEIGVGDWAVGFGSDRFIQATVLGPEGLYTIVSHHHGSS